eukprot:1395749-Amphidinium_carterae.1
MRSSCLGVHFACLGDVDDMTKMCSIGLMQAYPAPAICLEYASLMVSCCRLSFNSDSWVCANPVLAQAR